jgi:hypothetical protein
MSALQRITDSTRKSRNVRQWDGPAASPAGIVCKDYAAATRRSSPWIPSHHPWHRSASTLARKSFTSSASALTARLLFGGRSNDWRWPGPSSSCDLVWSEWRHRALCQPGPASTGPGAEDHPGDLLKAVREGAKRTITTMPRRLLKHPCGLTCVPCARRHRGTSSISRPATAFAPAWSRGEQRRSIRSEPFSSSNELLSGLERRPCATRSWHPEAYASRHLSLSRAPPSGAPQTLKHWMIEIRRLVVPCPTMRSPKRL